MKGKYYTPEAYGQPASKGVHYNEASEQTRAKAATMKQESMTAPEMRKTNELDPTDSRTKGKTTVKAIDSKENGEVLNTVDTKK